MTQDLPHDFACMSAELHDAFETYFPEYFALSAEEREAWRAGANEDAERIQGQIYDHLLINNFNISPEKIEDEEGKLFSRLRLDPKTQLAINLEMQCVRGVGHDMFVLNECLKEGQTLLDIETFRDYDAADYAFQQEHVSEEKRSPYRGSLYCSWGRMIAGGELRYLVMSTYAGFMLSQLESESFDILQELVPHKYDDGPNHMKETQEGFFEWDMVLNADGKEELYEALNYAARMYISKRYDTLLVERDEKRTGEVWIFDDFGPIKDDTPERENLTVVFADQDALANVRFRHFSEDCAKHEGDINQLATQLEAEKVALKTFLVALKGKLDDDTEKTTWFGTEKPVFEDIKALI